MKENKDNVARTAGDLTCQLLIVLYKHIIHSTNHRNRRGDVNLKKQMSQILVRL